LHRTATTQCGVVARQHPASTKGFAFLAVKDSGGVVNVIIAPDIYTRDQAALQGTFVLIDGVLQKDHNAANVITRQLIAL
jgi:hypothetical protein